MPEPSSAGIANPFLASHLTRLCHVDFCKLEAWPPASWAGFPWPLPQPEASAGGGQSCPFLDSGPGGAGTTPRSSLGRPSVSQAFSSLSEMFDISHPDVSLLLSYGCRKRTLKGWLEG